MKVKKREGNVVDFDFNKIINVITKVLKENNLRVCFLYQNLKSFV